jgi:hypothetical protein
LAFGVWVITDQPRHHCAAAMLKRIVPVLVLACGGDAVAPDECPCGAELTSEAVERAPYDAKLDEYRELSCRILGGAFRGECADGKVFLYRGGGFGHEALYYRDGRLVGVSRGTDAIVGDCPLTTYRGSLVDVTCPLANAEQLCSTSDVDRALPEIPFADGQLSPWCD